jgi:hypothetical protein
LAQRISVSETSEPASLGTHTPGQLRKSTGSRDSDRMPNTWNRRSRSGTPITTSADTRSG